MRTSSLAIALAPCHSLIAQAVLGCPTAHSFPSTSSANMCARPPHLTVLVREDGHGPGVRLHARLHIQAPTDGTVGVGEGGRGDALLRWVRLQVIRRHICMRGYVRVLSSSALDGTG